MKHGMDEEFVRMMLAADAAGEERNRKMNQLYEGAVWRFMREPVFHAEVTMMQRMLLEDGYFAQIEDLDEANDITLGLAAKAVITYEQLQPGGILDLRGL